MQHHKEHQPSCYGHILLSRLSLGQTVLTCGQSHLQIWQPGLGLMHVACDYWSELAGKQCKQPRKIWQNDLSPSCPGFLSLADEDFLASVPYVLCLSETYSAACESHATRLSHHSSRNTPTILYISSPLPSTFSTPFWIPVPYLSVGRCDLIREDRFTWQLCAKSFLTIRPVSSQPVCVPSFSKVSYRYVRVSSKLESCFVFTLRNEAYFTKVEERGNAMVLQQSKRVQ